MQVKWIEIKPPKKFIFPIPVPSVKEVFILLLLVGSFILGYCFGEAKKIGVATTLKTITPFDSIPEKPTEFIDAVSAMAYLTKQGYTASELSSEVDLAAKYYNPDNYKVSHAQEIKDDPSTCRDCELPDDGYLEDEHKRVSCLVTRFLGEEVTSGVEYTLEDILVHAANGLICRNYYMDLIMDAGRNLVIGHDDIAKKEMDLAENAALISEDEAFWACDELLAVYMNGDEVSRTFLEREHTGRPPYIRNLNDVLWDKVPYDPKEDTRYHVKYMKIVGNRPIYPEVIKLEHIMGLNTVR